MGKYFTDGEKVRITFEDGEWVDIKEELTQADSDYVMNQMTKSGKDGVSVDLGKIPLMERSILAWSFVEDSKPVPVTKETISNLRAKYRVVILQKIDEINIKAQEFTKNS